MKPILHENNGRTYCLVPVPDDAHNMGCIKNTFGIPCLIWTTGQSPFTAEDFARLPQGTYRFLFLASQATELEIYKSDMLEYGDIGHFERPEKEWRDYSNPMECAEEENFSLRTALESLASLILSLGLSGSVAVLEQK